MQAPPDTDTDNTVPPMRNRVMAVLRRLFGRKSRTEPIRDPAALRDFLQTRSSYVAQMTLYGYLRTRAGTRYAYLYEDEQFVVATNIAKWHVWLACLSDLAVFTGGMLQRKSSASGPDIGHLMREIVNQILADTGIPEEAGPEFSAHADRIRARVALCDWSAQTDGDTPFIESPSALVHWAPMVDVLKNLDEEIVRNSMRFRWREIRVQLRLALDATAVMAHQVREAGGDERAMPTV